MEVILLERIEKLGQMGEVVKVKDGFARNFLLPQKKALRASEDNLAYFEKERVTLEANNLKQKQEAEVILEKLDNFNLIIIRQAGETGQLYGSVNTNDIKNALNDHLRPLTISILDVKKVDENFHARFDAIQRKYLYRIINRKSPLTIEKGRELWFNKDK